MFDCSKDVLAYHDDEVTLPQAERTEMRDRRNANRDRLKRGLKDGSKPAPREFASQGSYAMKTMTQHDTKDYDIDDGVYFDRAALVGERGAEMTALQAKKMVRDAVDDGGFKTPPEVHTNCVRVYYQAGYHVDLPVYRRTITTDAWGKETFYSELAGSVWKRSDARNVTEWFETENTKLSPDTDNGRQVRRIVRQIKKFSRSRDSWRGQTLSGFGITKLVTECFRSHAGREDLSLYETMQAIRDRLSWNLVIAHPVTPNETITSGTDDSRARFLRERLSEAIANLAPLFDSNCTRDKALKCWDKAFATTYFSNRNAAKAQIASSLLKVASVTPPAAAFTFPATPRVDNRPRGFG